MENIDFATLFQGIGTMMASVWLSVRIIISTHEESIICRPFGYRGSKRKCSKSD